MDETRGTDAADGERITDLEAVPADGTFLFTVREGFDEREVVLTREDGDVHGWLNYCQHWTDVRLDTGDGAATRNGEIVCEKHGATFDGASGRCTHGPCVGAVLEAVEVAVADGAVYLIDGNYRFEHVGPADEVDLSSRGRIDF